MARTEGEDAKKEGCADIVSAARQRAGRQHGALDQAMNGRFSPPSGIGRSTIIRSASDHAVTWRRGTHASAEHSWADQDAPFSDTGEARPKKGIRSCCGRLPARFPFAPTRKMECFLPAIALSITLKPVSLLQGAMARDMNSVKIDCNRPYGNKYV
jgi:hypothetical protein